MKWRRQHEFRRRTLNVEKVEVFILRKPKTQKVRIKAKQPNKISMQKVMLLLPKKKGDLVAIEILVKVCGETHETTLIATFDECNAT
ncbi:hypothetical protein Syun_007070 [Stephania yunnanensis]|uniref:Uncharacterized protein n=1 Tax=Stephania yunnanensis TaxID=152371 RepID=A0AAP0KZL0_9MAGN